MTHYSLAEEFFTRRPYRSWAEVAASEGDFDGRVTLPMPLVRHKSLNMRQTLKFVLGINRPAQVYSDHILTRNTAGWQITRKGTNP